MESNKSNVIKSKSSNSAITTKSRFGEISPKEKKTKSSAEFQQKSPRLEKKRGVYVEKRLTKRHLNDAPDGKTMRLRSPKRAARRNKTEFLQSVLSILSKCTTSTQYPDDNAITIEKDGQTSSRLITQHEKLAKKKRRGSVSQKESGVNTIDLPKTLDPPKERRKHEKPKYKSKILNKILNDDDNLVVLKEKTNIVQTPSNYSEKFKDLSERSSKWSTHTPIVYVAEEKNVKFGNCQRSISESRVKEDRLQIHESETLVQIAQEKSEHNDTKAETGLYNFFVDLLETVYDDNDLKDDTEEPQVKFEIDEKVAKKLKLPTEVGEVCQIVRDNRIPVKTRSPLPCYTRCRWRNEYAIKSHMSRSRSPKSFRSLTRSMKSRSLARTTKTYDQSNTFEFAERYIKASPKSSVFSPRKTIKTKKTLLNILKEQLMEENTYEEPQSLFEALQIMARNKRKAKVIQFDEPPKYTKVDRPKSECWKRRRIISSDSKSCKQKRNKLTSKSFNTSSIFSSVMRSSKQSYLPSNLKSKSSFSIVPHKPRSALIDYVSDSFHSIEIEEIDDSSYMFANTNPKEIFYTDRNSTHTSKKDLFSADRHISKKLTMEVNSNKFHSALSDSLLDEPLDTNDSYLFKSLNKFLAGH